MLDRIRHPLHHHICDVLCSLRTRGNSRRYLDRRSPCESRRRTLTLNSKCIGLRSASLGSILQVQPISVRLRLVLREGVRAASVVRVVQASVFRVGVYAKEVDRLERVEEDPGDTAGPARDNQISNQVTPNKLCDHH